MSEYIGVVTNTGQAKIAAAIGGTALNLATIRVGDGNGAPIVPNPAMVDLVRRVGAAYPIISSGRDPVNANHWRVTALIPVDDGPFDIREIGVWDAAGEMIAVARHVLVEKRTPAQGAAVELLTDIVFPVSETAQVTVQIQPTSAVSILQMLRAGFTVVESATVTAPPGAPALGRTHVVPADAIGAWAGLAGHVTQWNGTVWTAVDVPAGFVVVAQDKAVEDPLRWLRRTADDWTSAMATPAAVGPTRLATPAEVAAGAAGVAMSPAEYHAHLAKAADAGPTGPFWSVLSRLPIHAEVITADGRLTITAGAGSVVVTGATIRWRGFKDFDLTALAAAARTFATVANKVYHLRWDAPGTGQAVPAADWPLGRLMLRDLADAAYNPAALAEDAPALDTTFDSLLLGLVTTSAGNVANPIPLANKTCLRSTASRPAVKPTPNFHATHSVYWGRTPTVSINAISAPGGGRDTDVMIYPSLVSRDYVQMYAFGWSYEQDSGAGAPSWGYTINMEA
jgi:hypothetical protein